MGWHPDQVRSVSLSDFMAALEGWQRAQGVDPDGPSNAPMGRDEFNELREQFPD